MKNHHLTFHLNEAETYRKPSLALHSKLISGWADRLGP